MLEAGDADEAIAILSERDDIRVLCADIDMPGSMDGLKLAAPVRDRWPPIKIIVTSGHRYMSDDTLPVEGRFFGKPPPQTHHKGRTRNGNGELMEVVV
ncbi:response regulator [Phyllobacterium sp. 1468]|uniref:response regulator transcription factor n=1 Tax=Phyllobacterium sp. 1468 TaxID=2817759 RepID=UPI00286D3DB3|nr:response regulator [Phyllobacterium sp. 1468]